MATRKQVQKATRVADVLRATRIAFCTLAELFSKALGIENARRKTKGEELLRNVVASLKRIPAFVVAYARAIIKSEWIRQPVKNRRPVFRRCRPSMAMYAR